MRGALQCLYAPAGGVFTVDIEGRFVELNNVHAIGLQRQRFLVQQGRKSHRHLDAPGLVAAVKAVGHGIDNRHRAGQGEFDFFVGVGAQQLRFHGVDPAFERERPHHLRHHRVVAVVAYAHLDLVLKVDAADLLQKSVDKVLSRLLAVTNDVQPGVFLHLDPQQGGICLGLQQRVAAGHPLRPEFLGLGQPFGLGQTARDAGGKQGHGQLPGGPRKSARGHANGFWARSGCGNAQGRLHTHEAADQDHQTAR